MSSSRGGRSPALRADGRPVSGANQPFLSGLLSTPRALMLPVGCGVALAALGLMPGVGQNPRLVWSCLGAAAAIWAWAAFLIITVRVSRRMLVLELDPRKQHYIQACAHATIFLYWGWYWREVYVWAPLILAQLLFAYAVDSLLVWSRRDTYPLGFGPFPVIFSINLFLWFKPDWFYLQLLMVAVGFVAKEFIQWNKDGRRAHVFNPSSFPLAVFSVVLIATGTSGVTWGHEIATTMLDAPYIFLLIVLVSLPGQLLFGVATMTMSAAATTYVFSLLYQQATGTYFFPDTFIPIAVFLGMHLLFTDPSTAPRSELGRILFGVLYALSVILLFDVLGKIGAPEFYDKLLAVPFLNLSIQLIDRAARSPWLKRLDPAAVGRTLTPRRRHLAYVALWVLGFSGISAAHVNTPETDGTTALHWAVRRDHLAPVRVLLSVGADARVENGYGVTPLAVAATNGNPAVIEALVDAGADPNGSLAEGLTMLMLGASAGEPDAVRVLLARGADVNAREPVLGETALMWAVKDNRAEAVTVLIEYGADVGARTRTSRIGLSTVDAAHDGSASSETGGLTALGYAARHNAGAAARTLLQAGADVNARGADDTTALLTAISGGHLDLAMLLLENHADPNLPDRKGVSPLYAAVDMNTVRDLGSRRPLPTTPGATTPVQLVQSLLEHGADPNTRLGTEDLTQGYDGGGRRVGVGATPLLRAAWRSDPVMVRLLLDHGADPMMATSKIVTPLMVAAGYRTPNASAGDHAGDTEENAVAVAGQLVSRSDVNAVNEEGETALHIAVRHRGYGFVQLLTDHGARVDIRDTQGRTPLDAALAGRNADAGMRSQVDERSVELLAKLAEAIGFRSVH
jgi:ankyrin repeat protein